MLWRLRTGVGLRVKSVGQGASLSPGGTQMVRPAPSESTFQEVLNQEQLEVAVPPTSEEVGTG